MIASHSSAYALADHPRNVPDDVLKLVKKNGGVVMVNFYSGVHPARRVRGLTQNMFEVHANCGRNSRTTTNTAGTTAVGRRTTDYPPASVHTSSITSSTSSKWPGSTTSASARTSTASRRCRGRLEDVSSYPVITQVLLDRGYNQEQIVKVLGGNLLRAMRRMEEVAAGK